MKKLNLIIYLLVPFMGLSQDTWMPVVNAEKRFASYALQTNTKEAFLKFMDTGAVVFKDGDILKAKPTWEAKKADRSRLIWEPAFAVVSTGGDIGITSGPWQYKPEGKDSVVATGEFTTVWIKKDTAYKWIIDMGIDHNQKIKSPSITGVALSHYERSGYPGLRYMLMAEQRFTDSYHATGKEAYRDVADNDIYLINNGYTPVHGVYRLDQALTNMSGTMKFQAVGSGCSQQGDLGYVYGYVNDKDKKGNYLRVWRRIGRKWMIILQTITI